MRFPRKFLVHSLATLVLGTFSTSNAVASDLWADFSSPVPLAEMPIDARPTYTMTCPPRRDYYSVDAAEQAATRRSVRASLPSDSSRYRDPQILAGILMGARDYLFQRCPILFRVPDGGITEVTDAGGIEIVRPGDAGPVVQVRLFSRDRIDTIYDLAPDSGDPVEQALAIYTPSEAQEIRERTDETPVPEPTPTPTPETMVESEADQPPVEAAIEEQAQPEPEVPLPALFAVVLIILILGRILLMAPSRPGPVHRTSSPPPAPRHPLDDIVDRAIDTGGRIDIDAFKSELHRRPDDASARAQRDRSFANAAARMRTDEARLNAEIERRWREEVARAETTARSSRAYDLTPTEAELFAAMMAHQTAAAKAERLKKG